MCGHFWYFIGLTIWFCCKEIRHSREEILRNKWASSIDSNSIEISLSLLITSRDKLESLTEGQSRCKLLFLSQWCIRQTGSLVDELE